MKRWKDLSKKEKKKRVLAIGGAAVCIAAGGALMYVNRDALSKAISGLPCSKKLNVTGSAATKPVLADPFEEARNNLTGRTLTVTDIGKKAGLKPHDVNLRLEKLGLVEKFYDGYHPTEAAKGLYKDVFKEYTDRNFSFWGIEWDEVISRMLISEDEIKAFDVAEAARKANYERIIRKYAEEDLKKVM